jgi:hypothetical protein
MLLLLLPVSCREGEFIVGVQSTLVKSNQRNDKFWP